MLSKLRSNKIVLFEIPTSHGTKSFFIVGFNNVHPVRLDSTIENNLVPWSTGTLSYFLLDLSKSLLLVSSRFLSFLSLINYIGVGALISHWIGRERGGGGVEPSYHTHACRWVDRSSECVAFNDSFLHKCLWIYSASATVLHAAFEQIKLAAASFVCCLASTYRHLLCRRRPAGLAAAGNAAFAGRPAAVECCVDPARSIDRWEAGSEAWGVRRRRRLNMCIVRIAASEFWSARWRTLFCHCIYVQINAMHCMCLYGHEILWLYTRYTQKS